MRTMTDEHPEDFTPLTRPVSTRIIHAGRRRFEDAIDALERNTSMLSIHASQNDDARTEGLAEVCAHLTREVRDLQTRLMEINDR